MAYPILFCSGSNLGYFKHAKAGKFSTSKNARGLQIVDIAELERYYEKLKPFPADIQPVDQNGEPETNETNETDGNGQPDTTETTEVDRNGQPETQAGTQEIIDLLKSELADAKERETKLLSMLETEQEKTRLLMLPPPQDQQPANTERQGPIVGLSKTHDTAIGLPLFYLYRL